MSNMNDNDQDFNGDKRPPKRSLAAVLARRQEQLDALRAKAVARRQKEKATKEALVRQMAQLQAKERRRMREAERNEAREVVRHLGMLALDSLIRGQEVGTPSLVLDWASIPAERRKLIDRVVYRGRVNGGTGAADMTADPSGPQPPEGDIDIRLDGDIA